MHKDIEIKFLDEGYKVCCRKEVGNPGTYDAVEHKYLEFGFEDFPDAAEKALSLHYMSKEGESHEKKGDESMYKVTVSHNSHNSYNSNSKNDDY